jgi:glycosyltransferase involved in cell wall biosynthesis
VSLSVKKIKIVLAIRSLDVGGAERLVLSLAEGIDKFRFEVAIVTIYDGTLDEQIPEGVRLIKAYKTTKYGYFGFLLNLYKVFKKFQPDIVYTHLGEMNLFASLVKPFLPFETKIVWCFHSAYLDYAALGWLSRFIFGAQKTLSRFPSRIVCVSEEVRRYHGALGFCVKNMSLIDNGVDTKKFIPNHEARDSFRLSHGLSDEFVVGMSARLDPIKGYTVLAKAAKILLNRGMKVSFVQMGGGDEGIRRECEEILGVYAASFVWLGSVNAPQAVYPAFDVLVSASLGEAFSLSVAEAMSCGVPIVASDVGVFRSLVGEGGIVIAPNDAEALADGIRALAGMDFASLGMIARKHIEQNYSLEKTVRRTQELFVEILR